MSLCKTWVASPESTRKEPTNIGEIVEIVALEHVKYCKKLQNFEQKCC